MSQALTLSERERYEARIAELEDELAAYRGFVRDDARAAARAAREWRVSEALRPGYRYAAGAGPARILLHLVDRPGRLCSKQALAEATREPGREDEAPEARLVDVYVCRLRKAFDALGLGDPIKTVWGRGYVVEEADAAAIKAALGEVSDGAA